ncbi:heme exporter protein CcmD [Sphingomonas sp. NSE70-1]|uniref:Heme exporter protein D n=1 Tax=Sphingomonas caseinilyticus TaxID=2908205 RepID=A0ABT0RQY2_9SPHN|nr:heme exporter protein CcmD [Sphingomonas caseinilyticus]MCL6697428.1 heme exporter protein CcmD [Sphingomonas caseinilyticus]
MNQWAFVVAAYGVTIVATVGLLAWAFLSMRTAEAEADALKRRQ